MRWLPVKTLPDGTAIEIPMPSADDTDEPSAHGYRVRGVDGTAEFSTLIEVAAHLLDTHGLHLGDNGAGNSARRSDVSHGLRSP
jgi:hypothetical protein